MSENSQVTDARAKAAQQWHIPGVALTTRQEFWNEFWRWNGAPPRAKEPRTRLALHGIREVREDGWPLPPSADDDIVANMAVLRVMPA